MIPYDAIVVLGPTASGKTKFAVQLAHLINDTPISYREVNSEGKKRSFAEIISADSRQVYKRMDIGTGKDLEEYSVPYHLINIVEPGTKYNVFEYQRDFIKVYADMRKRGVFPIICGGTGLYLQAVTCGYNLKEVPPDSVLRANLEQKQMNELVDMLTSLKAKNGEKPHNITDFDTKKRVIRAIEIELAYDNNIESDECDVANCDNVVNGVNDAVNGDNWKDRGNGDNKENRENAVEVTGRKLPLKTLFLGIEVDRDVRNVRIDKRLNDRLNAGMVDEVRSLLESGITADDLIYYGLEYKFVTQYITGVLSYNEMKDRLAVAIHQFAKRQMTWFRGMERKGIKIWWSEDGENFYNHMDEEKQTINGLILNIKNEIPIL